MGLLFTKIWSLFGNEGKIKLSLISVDVAETNSIIVFLSVILNSNIPYITFVAQLG